ncbi:unnamed protein product [Allacma fusca]|uniref:Uncharacterized protein n=1 Tax=Allacma fusca TaxID=39272 RepID=A0A8J2JJB5_9HEXA|nr:unnamed protein product [Allacma fusca]
MSEEKKGGSGGECETCLQRRAPYPENISKSDSSSGWSFWGLGGSSSNKQSCDSCAAKEPSKKEDPCKTGDPCQNESPPKQDKCETCGKENCECKKLTTEFKKPCGSTCPPWPAPQIPALCKPPWLCCPAKITVPPYPSPKGVEIRPISEGGRNNQCPGGKCTKCGVVHPPAASPKVSPKCPMMKPKCITAASKGAEANGKKNDGFMSKITSMFNIFGGKDKEKK